MLEIELPKLEDEGIELVSISRYVVLKNEKLTNSQMSAAAE